MKRQLKALIILGVATTLGIGFVVNSKVAATVPGTNEFVNVSSGGTLGNGAVNSNTSISQDGRYVVFESDATNLVASDTNGHRDIFLRDRVSATTTLVSVSSAGVQGNGDSNNPRISSTGRYVVYNSDATNLVSGAPQYQTYIYDTTNQTTDIVSVSSTGGNNNGDAVHPDVSSDGRFVSFQSNSTNLVSGAGSNLHEEIYVRDRQAGTNQIITNGNNNSTDAHIDCSGRFVVFDSSASNLVTGDTNGKPDVFLADRLGSSVSLTGLTLSGNNNSVRPAISCNGNYIAFESVATNLVGGDTNAKDDIFRYDRVGATTNRVSLSSAGVEGNNDSAYATISGDGRYVAYHSYASNLVSGDTNAVVDAFMTDATTGTTQRLAITSGGAQANGLNWQPAISADGKYVSYYAEASNLVSGDTNGRGDLFVSSTGENGCAF